MNWKEFCKKITMLNVKGGENIGVVGFTYKGEKYRIVSQWGSGVKRNIVNCCSLLNIYYRKFWHIFCYYIFNNITARLARKSF